MLHDDIDAIISQLVLTDRNLLKTNIVLEHLTEVDGYTLANGFVNWVFNIQFFQSVVAGIEHTQNTDDTVVVDLVISQIQAQQLVVREKQLCHHHRSICFDFVVV